MSESGPLGGDEGDKDPLSGVPFFLGDLGRLLRQQGSMGWDAARQVAVSLASGGISEPNVDPADRIRFEELARVADLNVADTTGLSTTTSGSGVKVGAVTKTAWAQDTLEAWKPLFTAMSESLQASPAPQVEEPEPAQDPMAFLRPFMQAMGPVIQSVTAGLMVGNLAQRAFGPYTLPIPRSSDELGVVLANVDSFGQSWSLPTDDLRLWICVHEITHHAVLGVAHVRDGLTGLLNSYVSSFEPDQGALEDRLEELAGSGAGPDALGGVFDDPEALIGVMRSDRQRELRPQLDALVSVVVGYTDHVLDVVTGRLLSSASQVTEALKRRRVEAGPADRFVESLFGLELSQATYDRGEAFVKGVLERGGEEGLSRLWLSERELPTPNEVDAPGLWLARIDLPD